MIDFDKYSDVLGPRWRQNVERSTNAFLRKYRDYLHIRGEKFTPPISIERIATDYLGLGLDILPLKERFACVSLDPEDEFLGAMNWDPDYAEWTIFLDQGLEECGHEGRVRFTMAHEIGHYLFDLTDEEKSLGEQSGKAPTPGSDPPRIFCRTSDALTPIERRADYAAACLIAPASLVKAYSKKWSERFRSIDGNAVKPMGRCEWSWLANFLGDEFGMSWNAMKRRIYEVGLYRDYQELWAA